MADQLQKAIAAILRWPAERQEEIAGLILALDRLERAPSRALAANRSLVEDSVGPTLQPSLGEDAAREFRFGNFPRREDNPGA